MAQYFTLPQFLKFIESLTVGGYLAIGQTGHPQSLRLPTQTVAALTQLYAAFLHQQPPAVLKQVFDEFYIPLVRISAHPPAVPTAETQGALFLLGLILHHQIHLTVDGTSYHSLQEYMMQIIYGDMVQRYQQFVYPSLEGLAAMLTPQAPTVPVQQQQTNLQHRFDDLVLNMRDFSFLLQAVCDNGIVGIFKNKNEKIPHYTLTEQSTKVLLNFATQARHSPDSPETMDCFRKLMKYLIFLAKGNPGDKFRAEQRLFGFLYYHNFRLQHIDNPVTIADIFWNNSNAAEFEALRAKGQQYVFLNDTWIQQQQFPGKTELSPVIQALLCPQPGVAAPTNTVNIEKSQTLLFAFNHQTTLTSVTSQPELVFPEIPRHSPSIGVD